MSAALLGQLYDAVCGESAVAKDGYLTWLSPGVPYEPGRVAELVDGAGEGRLSEVYADVLRRCLVVRGELSDAELLKVRRYRTLLRGNGTHVDPTTGDERTVTEDAPMFRAYQEHLAGYLAAELRCNLARVAGGSGWEADGPRHVAAVRDAMDAWLATGYRDEVEQVHSYLDQINRRDLVCWREHLIELYVHHAGEEPRVGFFFEATRWTGEPVNREPDKCSDIGWFPLADLPDGVIPYPAAGITGYLTAIPFSILGWGNSTPRPTSPPLRPLIPAG